MLTIEKFVHRPLRAKKPNRSVKTVVHYIHLSLHLYYRESIPGMGSSDIYDLT